MKDESGFTLVELLGVMLLTAILMTLGASLIRNYWFTQSLSGAQNEVIVQLRGQQQESRTRPPKVFGARFYLGQSDWELISYNSDPTLPPGQRCRVTQTRTLPGGSIVEAADFDNALTDLTATCPGNPDKRLVVLFYARGSATQGALTVHHPAVDKRLSVCVGGITGRVSEC